MQEEALLHHAPSVDPCHVEHKVDPVDDPATDDFPREIPGLHGAASEPGERSHRVVGVNGGERPPVPGIEGLEKVGRLGATHLPDNDVIGAVAERVLYQVADRDAPRAELAGLEANAVRVVDPELQGVLDGDDSLVSGKELDEGIEERGLPAPGATGDEDVPPRPQACRGRPPRAGPGETRARRAARPRRCACRTSES